MASRDGQAKTAPRRTLFEVEREKRWRIWLLFGLLVLLVLVTAWVACLLVCAILAAALSTPLVVDWLFTFSGVGAVLAVAVVVSLVYWGLVRVGARARLLKAMHCHPLDPGDRYHARLGDIVEEIRLATGSPRIDCVTVPTLGLNAFAFSDLRGGGVIGVTEGALSRLSRQQLEGVVAHEFAHILSEEYITVTTSCLLFGIYSSLADDLGDAVEASQDTPAAYAIFFMGPLLVWSWFMRIAASVVSGAISRHGEWRADAAAARYTRDPLSLAEALRIISMHPAGAGYLPPGLSPLCIRSAGGPAIPWSDTHPPIDDRIRALLGIANVSPADFERQMREAEEQYDGREHWSPAPAPQGPQAPLGGLAVPAAAVATPTAAPAAAAAPVAAAAVTGASALPAPVSPKVAPGGAGMTCPSCGAGLTRVPYEGLDIVLCDRCGGRLVTTDQAAKILARREAGFTDEQRELADRVEASGNSLRREAVLARGRPGTEHTGCPKCGAPMLRRHYDYEYAVEVDRCLSCDLIWFEKDELEALQILVERQTG